MVFKSYLIKRRESNENQKTIFGKFYLESSTGKRLTKSHKELKGKDFGPFYTLSAYDNFSFYYYAFDTKTEKIIERSNDFVSGVDLGNDSCALVTSSSVTVYNKGKIVLQDVKSIQTVFNIRFARIGDSYYFLDDDCNICSRAFRYISNAKCLEYIYTIEVDESITLFDQKLETVINISDIKAIEPISKDYFAVKKEFEKWGVIDRNYKEILPCEFSEICWQKGKYIKVKYGKTYGLYDTDGNVIFDTIYDDIIETPNKFIVKDFRKFEVIKEKAVEK